MIKNILLLLILLPSLVFSQDIPETVEKSVFNRSRFGGNFSYEILQRLLKEDSSILTSDADKLNIKANDLYYEQSRPFEETRKIDNLFRYKYLISREIQIDELNSILNDNNWTTTIVKNNLLSEILEPISKGSTLSIKNNTIYLSKSSTSENWKKYIYEFTFDKGKNVIFQGYGYTTTSKDTLLWNQTNSEYKNNEIFKQIKSIYRESDGKLELKDSETTYYQNSQILKKTEEVFNKKNEKYREISTNYFYNNNKLTHSKSITKIFRDKIEFKEPLSITEIKYKENKPIEISESGEELKTLRINKYDKKNRLIWSEYKSKDERGKVIEELIEEIEYFNNKYVYRYKEILKILNGKERLPLQYELIFSFLAK